jgi:uncharacterized membrane protein (UPF0136 family)
VLLQAANGWFLYDGTRFARKNADLTGQIYDWRTTAGGLLLGAENGLFRYDGNRVARVDDDLTGEVYGWRELPGGLLLRTKKGLFNYFYDGAPASLVGGDSTGTVIDWRDAPGGLLLSTEKGLFRYFYDGARVAIVEGDLTGNVLNWRNAPGGLLLQSRTGWFRYDGTRVARADGNLTGTIVSSRKVPGGLLLRTDSDQLGYYNGTHVARIEGNLTERFEDWHDAPGGILVRTQNKVFRVIDQTLSTSMVQLVNHSQLEGAAPSAIGIPTRWTMVHPCSALAYRFNLHVVAMSETGTDVAEQPAIGFQLTGQTASFEAVVPIPDAGRWTFRVVSLANGTKINVGQRSPPVAFVAPVPPGLVGLLASWWKPIAGIPVAIVVTFNLIVFGRARYSASAWRFATDDSWGTKALTPLMLLLRQSRLAQLWLLDLYVRGCRDALPKRPPPFLPLPLTHASGAVAKSDTVVARLASTRHLWIRGGTGMGKTAIFGHLIQAHFGRAAATSFAIFERDGYVLVPIEARRFPAGNFDEKRSSAWVLGTILSVLSERGLSIADNTLLRAMLSKGCLPLPLMV